MSEIDTRIDSTRLAEAVRPLFAEFDKKLEKIRNSAVELSTEIDNLAREEARILEDLNRRQSSPNAQSSEDRRIVETLRVQLIQCQTSQMHLRERQNILSGLASSQRRTIEAFLRQISQRIEHAVADEVIRIELAARLGSLENELRATSNIVSASSR
jgi:hypothetical protein